MGTAKEPPQEPPQEPAANGGRALRADAERNRRRIVDAARDAFAEKGLEAPLEDIASRAGVGIATLYRRFPTREELVAAVFECHLREHAEAAEKALTTPDPWTGFTEYVERVCHMQAANRGFTDVSTMALSTSADAEHLRERAYEAVVALLRRAQEAGAMHEDVVPEDIPLLLMANAGVVHATRDAAPHAWRRLIAFLLEGFRAGHTGPLPAPPTPAQTLRALHGNAYAKGMCSGRAQEAR